MAELSLFEDAELTVPFLRVELSDLEIVEGIGEGEPTQIWALVKDGHLRQIEVALEGPGAENVQLAVDDGDGHPAVWSAEGIMINSGGTVFDGEKFSFWVRGVYAFDDREDTLPFNFNVKAKAIG